MISMGRKGPLIRHSGLTSDVIVEIRSVSKLIAADASYSEIYHTTSMFREGVIIKNLLSATNEKWHDRNWRLINPAPLLTQIRYEPWVGSGIAIFRRGNGIGRISRAVSDQETLPDKFLLA